MFLIVINKNGGGNVKSIEIEDFNNLLTLPPP